MKFLLSIFTISLLSLGLHSNTDIPAHCAVLNHTNNELKNICDKDNKPYLLVEFFSAGCGHCQRNVEPFKRLEEKIKELAFSRLITADSPQVAINFARANNIETPIALDAQRLAARAFNVRGYPTMFVLDANNQIIFRQVGSLTDAKIDFIYELLTSLPAHEQF
jgi:thioredoxin-related protein